MRALSGSWVLELHGRRTNQTAEAKRPAGPERQWDMLTTRNLPAFLAPVREETERLARLPDDAKIKFKKFKDSGTSAGVDVKIKHGGAITGGDVKLGGGQAPPDVQCFPTNKAAVDVLTTVGIPTIPLIE